MNICIIGCDSFNGMRVGINHIAESLSKQGHIVDYITEPVCLMTIFSKRRKKYIDSFKFKKVNKNLTEIVPVCVFPGKLIKLFEGKYLEKLLFDVNIKFIKSRTNYIENKEYDLCIFAVSTTSYYFVKKINANKYIYRHNDILEEFKSISNVFVKYERYLLKNFPISLVASVNKSTAKYIKNINKSLNVKVTPNGIATDLFIKAIPDKNLEKSKNKNIIYIGSIDFWVDLDLIINTAIILKKYNFYIYAKWIKKKPRNIPSNIFLNNSIPYEEVPKKLKACSVGIIPFNKNNINMFVEKPLKYYEYLASGLGIASTSHGMDKTDKFVCFGDTPKKFAEAIIKANENKEMFKEEKQKELEQMDWNTIVNKIIE